MTLNILNRTVKNKNAWLKTKYLLMQLKFKKKNHEFIYFIFMIKVRYVCLLKCFLNILKQTNDSVLKIIKKTLQSNNSM